MSASLIGGELTVEIPVSDLFDMITPALPASMRSFVIELTEVNFEPAMHSTKPGEEEPTPPRLCVVVRVRS